VAGVLGNLTETIEIGKNQVGALVSGCAARKTDGETSGSNLRPVFSRNRFEQVVFGKQMSRPDFLRGQS